MAKTINCKHGLDRKQEIEARRLKDKLEAREKETVTMFHNLYEEYKNSQSSYTFDEFLKERDMVAYSAYARATTSHLLKIIVDIDIRNG